MRFLSNGPDIPDDLLSLQERGETLFVCGAGVSRTICLPLFRGLVEGVYRELGEDWTLHTAEYEGMRDDGALSGQYDRVLRCLEKRLGASNLPHTQGMRERIRSAVRKVLELPDKPDFVNHLALLELSRDAEGRTRLLTTNFDTAFERAWFNKYNERIASHSGTSMPQPKVWGFTGVLHLHGRLNNSCTELGLEETDLVLTSAEFGDAYLRSGWASRYVYDLVRTHTLVLVGYQADDPPMRYLLEALEADRERYPDLRQVYAFASFSPNQEDFTRALWRAKGVEPVLYEANGDDHSSLYRTLQEWRAYAEDPTAWRRERLGGILRKAPASVDEIQIEECASLLEHGDASQILAELSPNAEWLTLLFNRRVFDSGVARPDQWIATRLDDSNMIRACASLKIFDKQTRWFIQRSMDTNEQTLTSIQLKAWQLILAVNRPSPVVDLDDAWFRTARRIEQGETGYSARQLVAKVLRPQLEIREPFFWDDEVKDEEPETLDSLISIDFRSKSYPSAKEILKSWPQELDQEVALFHTLERTLIDALEEARDVDMVDGWDRASSDVPSIAPHQQNAHHSRFYPITRVIADVWERVAAKDRDKARMIVLGWSSSPFTLVRRLHLYALSFPDIFTMEEVAATILTLDSNIFWLGGAQVEIMHLLTKRWSEFGREDLNAIEMRLREGVPRDLFPDGAFDQEEKWISIKDHSVYRRLTRIVAEGCEISAATSEVLKEISKRHPTWQPSPGDRDDFQVWHESHSGPKGHPELLADITDDALVAEAMRLQRERHFEEPDIWRMFCAADPDRALRALVLEAGTSRWNFDAWRSLLWAAYDKGGLGFQCELAAQLASMPDDPLSELLSAATSWLQKRRETLTECDEPEQTNFLQLWDRFAEVAYAENSDADVTSDGDVLTHAHNEPGGVLAWALLDYLRASSPTVDSGFGLELTSRFDLIVQSHGRAGLLARAYLAHTLSYLDWVDPTWTSANLLPCFSWPHPEALILWGTQAADRVGSARLFNSLKPALLQPFEQHGISESALENLVTRLLNIAVWQGQGNASDYDLSRVEIKRALSSGPPVVRQNATWQLWHLMSEADGCPENKAERWHTLIGPLFQDIWPLDAGLRTEKTAENLVLMALECEDAFPDAVDAIIDFIVPYQLYHLSHSLRLERRHDQLVSQHPAAFVRLANALIDPAVYPVPDDLASLLKECVKADPQVEKQPGYIRLYGLRRLKSA